MLRIQAKLLVGVLLALPFYSISQDWKALFQAKGPSTVLSRGVEMGPHNEIYWIGIFEQYVVLGGDTLHSAGSADGFIAKYGDNGIKEWSLRFGGTNLDRVMSTTIDKTGNLYLTGGFSDEVIFGNDTLYSPDRDVFVVKYDSAGQALWAKSLTGNQSDFGQGIVVDHAGQIYLTGIFMSDSLNIGSHTLYRQGSSDMFLLKLDNGGNPIWIQQGGATSTTLGNALALDSLNNIYLTGSFQDSASFSGQWLYSQGRSDAYVACYQPSGNLNWIRSIQGAGFDAGQALAGTRDGVLVTGRYSDVLSLDTFTLNHTGSYDIFMANYDANGSVKWAKSIGGSSKDRSYGIDYQENTGIYLVGEYSDQVNFDQKNISSQGSTDAFLAKYDAFGTNRWVLSAGGMNKEQAYAAFASRNQQIHFAGHFRDFATFDSTTLSSGGRDDAFLARINDHDSIPPPPINILPIHGRIFEDANLNCLADSQEMNYKNWFVVAEPGPYFGLSDKKGEFTFDLSPGLYQVRNILPLDQSSWLYSNCPPIQYASTGYTGPTQNPLTLPFGQVEKAFVQLQLSVDAHEFVRCQAGEMVIDYANIGADPARDVSIQLILPEELSLTNSNVPFRSLSGGKYLFSIPDLSPQHGGQINLTYIASCNAVALAGKNLSVQAEIHSPSIRNIVDLRWNGAEVQIEGHCMEADSALFILKNTGQSALSDSVALRFFADDVLCNESNIWLAAGDSLGFLVPSSGKTIRCEVQQAAFHPQNTWVQTSVEACTIDSRFPVSLGYQQHFSQYDGNPTSRFQLNRQFHDAPPLMDWAVMPVGRGRLHGVEPGERLFYHFAFQAPSKKTTHYIQINDTLPTWLDPASMRWEAHSHNFDISVDGKGAPVLHFSLANDSLQAGEQGFVSFSMKLKARAPLGTQIRQRAWMQVDSTSWEPTSWIYHTIEEDKLDRSCRLGILPYDFSPLITTDIDQNVAFEAISIFPNPFSNSLQIRFAVPGYAQNIKILDLSGKQLMGVFPMNEAEIKMDVSTLPSGVYFVHISTKEGKRVFKVIKR